jgi:hypothetical protein
MLQGSAIASTNAAQTHFGHAHEPQMIQCRARGIWEWWTGRRPLAMSCLYKRKERPAHLPFDAYFDSLMALKATARPNA